MHDILVQHGYKLIDDEWKENGRRTYDHNDDATREFIASLTKVLQSAGWKTHPIILRAFRHLVNAEIIEVEVGGPEKTDAHFLHHLKAFD